MINITSIVTRDYNKLIERISKFTDLYLSDHRNKFSIMFDGANINDYDFAKNFVHYANQYPNEFEEMWSKIKPYNILEKIRHKLVIIIVLLLIFGLPLYFIVFKNSNLSLNDLIYDTQLHASEYIVVETKYNEQKELIVTVKYNVNGKEYTEDVKVKGNEWNWRINGGLYYNDNKPENLIYIEN